MTTLGADPAQVEYRLAEDCGCDLDHQVEYRMAQPRDLEWIGSGLAEVDLVPGDIVDKDAARALMAGADPRTGKQLVRVKVEVDPRAKLSGAVLLAAVTEAAERAGVDTAALLDDDKLADRLARVARQVKRDGDAHRVPIDAVEDIAAAAGLDVAELYDADELALARKHRDDRVSVRNAGYDLTLDLPKSYSALFGVADDVLAAELEGVFLQAARETFGAFEGWTGYTMRGHHGDGRRAERADSSGLLGWMTTHRSARPVGGGPGDPHLHVHITFANLARSTDDGKWRAPGAGGRDVHRHALAADALVKARLRELTEQRFGMRWERSPETGAWEVVGIPQQLRTAFSRRHLQIADAVSEGMTTREEKLVARQLAERKSDQAVSERGDWLHRAGQVDVDGRPLDVAAMVRAAVPGWDGPGGGAATGPGGPDGPQHPSPERIAAWIWREDGGLVEHTKVVTRAAVLAAVIDACPRGLASAEQAERLVDEVLAVEGHAVRLPDQGADHMSNAQRYTHTSILAAEQAITETAAARLSEGAARITPEAAELALSTFEASRGFRLSDQQRHVVERLLTAGHGLDVVVGVAGAGKTTLMEAARVGWEAAGLRVCGAATAAVAAANLATEAGIESSTIAGWLRADHPGPGLDQVDVLVVDEGAMVDDRAVAELLRRAGESGTKIVMIGDPQQLRAIGVGGGFAAAHALVDGAVLTENRRQRDAAERAALEVWRDGARTTALAAFAEAGHVHATDTAEQAHTGMLTAWLDQRRRWEADPHELTERLVVLAATNADVELLNAAARRLLHEHGQLTGERTYLQAGGRTLDLAVGDQVRVRKNDYRSRRDSSQPDVLNGFRGVVREIDDTGRALVEWRRSGPDGHLLQQAWITPDQIAAGALSHGYAMTIAAAQGLTADVALVYGMGADAHSLYPALSRAREATHLWLPAMLLEDEPTRLRLGEPRTEDERLRRAVAAYGRALEGDQPDRLVLDELTADRAPALPHPRPTDDGDYLLAPPAAPSPRTGLQEPGIPEQAETAHHAAEAGERQGGPVEEVDIDRLVEADRAEAAAGMELPSEEEMEAIAAAEAERVRAELVRAAVEAGIAPWQDRRYGALSTGSLLPKAEEAERDAATADRKAEQLQGHADIARSLLGTSEAPGQQRVDDVSGLLAAVAEKVEHVQALEQLLRRAGEDQADARAAKEEAERQAARGRLALRLDGTSRAEQQEAAAQALARRIAAEDGAREIRQLLHTAGQEAVRLLRPVAHTLQRTPWPANDGTQMAERLADLQQALPAYAERHAAQDQQRVDRLQAQADEQRSLAAAKQSRASDLRTEAAVRTTLSPQRQATESTERTAHRLAVATQRAAEQARRAARQAEAQRIAEQNRSYRYEPPTQGRSGPSRGR
ncbi:MobF family relaxase [Kitasatospora sp. NPDC059088]|uniref:MobF family relaxase n=1 Tax=Kitasatospora sp. NPDC059088 TaxID=3346722 RepID=UPI0036A719BD